MNAKAIDPDKPKTFSTKIDLGIAKKLFKDLESQGFEISKPQYTLFSAKKPGLSCTLYESGKLLVQGKEAPTFLEFYLEPEILGSFKYSYANLEIDTSAHIGIDEAGKGDFFGPLCVAGVYASGDAILKLKEIGVKDSKSMTDSAVIQLGRKIQKEFDHQIVRINPAKYNELYEKFRNLNHLLAWGHATAIESLHKSTNCNHVLIDQFAAESVVETALKRKGLNLNLTQRHRGEEDLVVAAASILARQAFLEGLEKLGKDFSMVLPKGASSAVIKAGGKFIQTYGRGELGKVAKLHFKTLDAILAENPEYRYEQ